MASSRKSRQINRSRAIRRARGAVHRPEYVDEVSMSAAAPDSAEPRRTTRAESGMKTRQALPGWKRLYTLSGLVVLAIVATASFAAGSLRRSVETPGLAAPVPIVPVANPGGLPAVGKPQPLGNGRGSLVMAAVPIGEGLVDVGVVLHANPTHVSPSEWLRTEFDPDGLIVTEPVTTPIGSGVRVVSSDRWASAEGAAAISAFPVVAVVAGQRQIVTYERLNGVIVSDDELTAAIQKVRLQ
jgi:hypothetical protein